MSRRAYLVGLFLVPLAGAAVAQQVTVDLNRVSSEGVGEKVGTVIVSTARKGLQFKISATGIPPGPHGFHVHENGGCGPAVVDGKMAAAGQAGEHFDPAGAKSHKGPAGAGHKGDLPVLQATKTGIEQSVTAPRLALSDVRGRALVIHEGADTYKDQPKDGGGNARIACGVVPKE